MVQKTRLVHSIQLRDFLIECGLEPLEEIDNPFREGFKSWRFVNNKKFKELMEVYTSEANTFEEICSYISEKANEGIIFYLIDNSKGADAHDCKFLIHEQTRKIFILRK